MWWKVINAQCYYKNSRGIIIADNSDVHETDDIKMTDVFEVEKIVASKRSHGQTLYKIRWRTFGPEDDTWEPARHLKGCQELQDEFHGKQVAKTTSSQRRPINPVKAASANHAVADNVLPAVNSPMDFGLKKDSDILAVRDRSGAGDNCFFGRSARRQEFTGALHTTAQEIAGSQVKTRTAEVVIDDSDSESKDGPISPFLAGLCVILIIFAIILVYLVP